MSTTAYIVVGVGGLIVVVVLMLLIGEIKNSFIGWVLGAILFILATGFVTSLGDANAPDVVRPSFSP